MAMQVSADEQLDAYKSRLFKTIDGVEAEDDNCFSIVTYNIAAERTEDGLSELNSRNYAELVMKELQLLDADVFCLQSVAVAFWNTLDENLKKLGYTTVKEKRRPSEGEIDFFDVVAYRKCRFTCLSSHCLLLDDLIIHQCHQLGQYYHPDIMGSIRSREVAICVTLFCPKSQRKISIASTRCIQASKNRPDLQTLQVCSIVKDMKTANPTIPIIICGDMGFKPNELGPYQVVMEGKMNAQTVSSFKDIKNIHTNKDSYPLSIIYKKGFSHPMTTLRSAYAKVMGYEPPNKWSRDGKEFACSSYIFYDEEKVKVAGVLDSVDSHLVTDEGLPSIIFPSSSLSLKAVFTFGEK